MTEDMLRKSQLDCFSVFVFFMMNNALIKFLPAAVCLRLAKKVCELVLVSREFF